MTGVIILNYNNAELTLKCLDSVVTHNTYPSKYIIVDNASTDDSVRILTDAMCERYTTDFSIWDSEESPECLARFNLVCSPVNGGYAQGNNIGLRLVGKDSNVDTVMILNNDIVFIEDILPTLVSFLNTTPDVGIVSPLLLKKDGISIDFNCARKDCSLKEIMWYYLLYCSDYKGILSRYADERKILERDKSLLQADSVPIELPSGSCMLIKKALFQEIGLFDPNTFLYYEEGILFRKLERIHKINYVLPQVRCIHLGAQTTTKSNRSYSYLKHSNRSAYYYVTHYRKLNLFQRIGFALLYWMYNTLLFIKQHI